MIVIATLNEKVWQRWHNDIKPYADVHETQVKTYRLLTHCMKILPVSLLIIDKQLFKHRIYAVLSTLHNKFAICPVLLLDDKPSDTVIAESLLFGASAVVDYQFAPKNLSALLNTILSGRVWLERAIMEMICNRFSEIAHITHQENERVLQGVAQLTEREKQIARSVARGKTNQQVAKQLSITERTVKAHLTMVYRKLNLHDRTQLALLFHHQPFTE